MFGIFRKAVDKVKTPETNLYIGETPISPTTAFFAGSVWDKIVGKIYFPAIVLTTHGDISLEVYPSRCKREEEDDLIRRLQIYPRILSQSQMHPIGRVPYGDYPIYGDMLEAAVGELNQLREDTHYKLELMKKLEEGTLGEEIRRLNDEISLEMPKMDEHFLFSKMVWVNPDAYYQLKRRLSIAIDVLERKEHFSSIENLETLIRREESQFKPFSDHYLTVKSVHGSVELVVYDPDAIVDILDATHVTTEPADYTPRSTRRKIGINAPHGDISISYKPQIPIIQSRPPNNISADN